MRALTFQGCFSSRWSSLSPEPPESHLTGIQTTTEDNEGGYGGDRHSLRVPYPQAPLGSMKPPLLFLKPPWEVDAVTVPLTR